MKKIPKLPINLLFGVFTGLLVSVFVINALNLFLAYLSYKEYSLNYKLLSNIAKRIGIVLFIIILIYSLKRKIKKLSTYLIMAIITAIGGTVVTCFIILRIFGNFFNPEKISDFMQHENGSIILMSLSYLGILALLILFNLIFKRLIDQKVKYILYISKEVKRIEEEGAGILLREEGADELTQLCQGINSMSMKLQDEMEYEKKLEAEKNELITNVSHDLRTPLTSIMGYLQLLKLEGYEDREKFNEYMEVIERRVGGLKNMIDELFEFTKLSSIEHQMNLTRMDVIPMVRHLIQEYQLIYQKEQFQLHTTFSIDACPIIIDCNQIMRVFQNLLDNARKYAKRESIIDIRIYDTSDWFVFEIENEVETEDSIDVIRLFDRFYIADTARTKQDSSGIGLAIVKRIVELHHGELTAEFENNKILFRIRLTKQS